jgi:glycogen(starch) synthase
MSPEGAVLFEVSWEVCNKVGGISTVIKSKAPRILEIYGQENYTAVGPYVPGMVQGEFEEAPVPKEYSAVCKNLAGEGIRLHFGKWLIKGLPSVILVDFKGFIGNSDSVKKELWEKFGISSIRASYDYDEPIVWGYAAGRVLQLVLAQNPGRKTVVQFHEWLSGGALLYLKMNDVKVATVFTTHATILGRTLASSGVDLYSKMKSIDSEKSAFDYGIEAKFGVEKQSALNADVFTTVSEITGIEAEAFLGRKPDVLLPNGLDMDKFPTFEEASVQHRLMREKIREFISYYFFPYYSFDIEETLVYFLAGRYEFRDKGIDIYIKALARLDGLMKKENSSKTIVAFIFVPGDVYSIYQNIVENHTNFIDVKDGLDDEMPYIRSRIMSALLSQSDISSFSVFSQDFAAETKKRVLKFRKQGFPELSTHLLKSGDDIIIKTLHSVGLANSAESRVKVIFYPIYLTGADGLLDLSYYEAMQGAHLGVFPSFYEPWGYTPLEAAALGVSSVTTDLAGFGRYILKESDGKKIPGVFVLKRERKSDEEIVESLARFMLDFADFSKDERVKNKLMAKTIAAKADWKFLIGEYVLAHNLALSKHKGG